MKARMPSYGAIGPMTTIAVHVNPPLEAGERVQVISSAPSETTADPIKLDVVVVANRSDKPIAYMLVYTPANIELPPPEAWKDLWVQIRATLNKVMKR